LKSGIVIPLALLFLLKIAWLFGVFCVSIWILGLLSMSVKSNYRILMGIAFNLKIAFGRMAI
jgi:hypothetical protein